MDRNALTAPWSDQVKGSWWKALIIGAIYLYIRFAMELRIMGRAAQSEGLDLLNMMNFTPEEYGRLYQAMDLNYFLLAIGLFILVVVLCRAFGFKFFDFKTITLSSVLKTIGFFFIAFLIQAALNLTITYFFPDYTQPANQDAVEQMVSSMNLVFMFINIVILTPIVEEYLFRGLIMKYIFSLTPLLGALVASVAFALAHMPGNWIDFAVYYVLSVAFTYVYLKTRRLEYPILMHMMQNFIGFLAVALTQGS